ncbi:efflux RND transporter permease subunit [Vibrio parahaemolyticus]|uniref:efflux RND transporter permease subunit n=1 Tax=Vibrio mediterranei TaxID=689 RepID=UPI004068B260
MNRLFSVIQRFSKLVLIFVTFITGVAIWYGQQHFRMNADLSSLVEQNGAWVDDLEYLNKTFPESGNVTVLVTTANGSDVKVHVAAIAEQLRGQAIFTEVFAPQLLTWFEEHPLGFVSQNEFDRIKAFTRDTIKPVALAAQTGSLDLYFAELAQSDQPNLTPLLAAINNQSVDWAKLAQKNLTKPTAYAITLVAEPDASATEPNRAIIEAINHSILAVDLPSDVDVKITGQAALDFDEIADANNSIALAGSTSLIGLILILAIGIRSLRVIVACYLTVLVGLAWTFAAGLAVIGHYNTISIVFMVMFIGLAVDFSIHLCLHIQELRLKGESDSLAIRDAIAHSVRPLSLCALSSALGFLSFYPTAYTGLGELGVVSALGMVLGLVATFIIIPLFFTLFGYPRVRHQPDTHRFAWFGAQLMRYKGAVFSIAIALTVVMGYGATQFKFDFSTLVLKNPQSESVLALNQLQQEGLGSSYQLFAIAKNQQQAEQWQKRLIKQPSVDSVRVVSDFMPKHLEQRTGQLQALFTESNIVTPMSYSEFVAKAKAGRWQGSVRLPDAIDSAMVAGHLFAGLSSSLNTLTQFEPVSIESLPTALTERYISQQGEWLVVISPSQDMTNVDALEQFIAEVKQIAPNATGRAVAEQEVGSIIVSAFQAAIMMSVFGIALILIWTVEKKRDVLLIFIPLTLASVSTLGLMHWLGLSMNMANIIVIPLIFGLGVDNGIHIVKRFRAVRSLTAFFKTSTPKASLVSCLTTLATFGALIVADHQGMHSIGLVLTIALSCILVFSLTLLPLLLEVTKKKPIE